MITNFYSVKDLKVGYGNPFSQPNDDCACRTFRIWLNSDTELAKSPEDYELYGLGTYDTDTGVFSSDVRAIVRKDVL